MRDGVYLLLRASTYIMVLASYLGLSAVPAYGPAIMILPFVLLPLMPIGERLDKKYPTYRLMSRGATIAVLCFLPFLWVVLENNALNTVLTVVIYIQGYTLLHQKGERSYYHLFLMSFFLLIAACFREPDPLIAIALLLFFGSAITGFMALRLDVERKQSGTQSFGLFRVSREANGVLEPVDESMLNWASLSRTAGSLFAVSFVMTVFFFLITPRTEAGLLGRDNPVAARTGLSQEVDLRGGAYVQEDQTPVMNVTFPDYEGGEAPVDSDELYWRVSTMPLYQGSTWRRAPLTEHYEARISPFNTGVGNDPFHGNPLRVSRSSRRDVPVLRQVIYMDNVPDQGVPALDLVRSVVATGRPRQVRLSWDAFLDFTVGFASNGPRRLTYEVESEVPQYSPAALRASPDTYAWLTDRDRALLLDHELQPETVALAASLVEGIDNVYDKALAIEGWLSSSDFEYTLSLPAYAQGSAIDQFILEVRQGHCEFFASAMALMLRSTGVPTRVVSGFRGGEWSGVNESYTVRAAMAHLWVEVLIPNVGWVRFDPSPPAGDDPATTLVTAARLFSSALLQARMLWYRDVVGFDSGIEFSQLRNASLGFIRSLRNRGQTSTEAVGEGAAVAAGNVALTTRLWWLPYTVVALVVVAIGWLVYRWRGQRSEWVLTEDQARAVRMCRVIRRRLERVGISARTLTAEEIRHALTAFPAESQERLGRVLAMYNEVRFGMRPLPPERFRQAMQDLRAVRLRPAQTR